MLFYTDVSGDKKIGLGSSYGANVDAIETSIYCCAHCLEHCLWTWNMTQYSVLCID